MIVLKAQNWQDYEFLDCGNGFRLERFGKYILSRPDPQIIWKPNLDKNIWDKADAVFNRTEKDRGEWKTNSDIPEKWLMHYDNLSFWAKLTPFKHTGVFPEQSVQWNWISEKIQKEGRSVNILNLFGYTGISSLVCASVGAKVTHVDASKPAITWARENQQASKLMDKPIRWIPEDAIKFTQRELKRGARYDGIIMDPPVYGHGPQGEIWKFNEDFPRLLQICRSLLCDHPLFILINAYAISSSAIMLENVLKDEVGNLGGMIEAGELALSQKDTGRLLSTGIFGRWCNI